MAYFILLVMLLLAESIFIFVRFLLEDVGCSVLRLVSIKCVNNRRKSLLRFAGFHKQPSFGLLRGFWDFQKSSLFFLVFGFARFFQKTENIFCFLRCGFSIDLSHSISRHRPLKPSQKFNMCDFVASSQAFAAKAVIACDHWCPYIVRHRALLCVLLTHVWKPGFRL